ncbi:uncharacterized protein [Blastocystis hominis]|uniref:PUM-HD domain-containing protein n=1 Tax=Blastocystis hominis TaxID=12968 RepID=D8M1J6_BLAHO|nr:uncharacterized protein [Blastocystis hominis]CBK21935.2 unnamed protein product [Blastocystis hominis]|eukprot:XP_012895983.1 uncharacterized protein [Blastocystis hominis]
MGKGALNPAEPGPVGGMAGLSGADASHASHASESLNPNCSPRANTNGRLSPRPTSSSQIRVNANATINATVNATVNANVNAKSVAGAGHLGPTEPDKPAAARVLNASNAPSESSASSMSGMCVGNCPIHPPVPNAPTEPKPEPRSSRKDRDRDAKQKRASRPDSKASDDRLFQNQNQNQNQNPSQNSNQAPLQPRSKSKSKSKSRSRPDSERGQVDLKGLRDHVVDMAKNYNGCRALQQILLTASPAAVTEIFEELQSSLRELMTDPFGNYVFQMLLQVCSEERRAQILSAVRDFVIDASLNIHGTRCVQSLVQYCSSPSMIDSLFAALQGHIAHLAAHPNGNHVILRCLQSIPESFCTPLFEELVQHCIDIATHRHGCCVIQQFFLRAPPLYRNRLMNAILHEAHLLITNPFGNYVVQFVLERGRPEERELLTRSVFGHVVEYSCQKYSSNVIEKVIVLADEQVRYQIICEIVGSPHFPAILHHNFANYIIQNLFHNCGKENVFVLYDAILPFKGELGRSTGGRHILTALNAFEYFAPISAIQ